MDFEQPPQGAYTELADLIALRFAARQVDITRRRRALSHMSGSNAANFRGRGIDFDEVRSYQPGDDIRAIDWRVTARTGSAHTKLFHEERERPVLVVVDQRPGMFFGSKHCFKSVLAAQTAALIAWSALEAGERVGGLVFGADGHRDCRPRRSRSAVLGLLSIVNDFNHALTDPNAASSGADILPKLRRIARPGSSVFLITDGADLFDGDSSEHLYQLSRHVELTVLQCTDPLERELPPPGSYAIHDGRNRNTLATGGAGRRRAFAALVAEQDSLVGNTLGRLGVPRIAISTDDAPLTRLRSIFGQAGR